MREPGGFGRGGPVQSEIRSPSLPAARAYGSYAAHVGQEGNSSTDDTPATHTNKIFQLMIAPVAFSHASPGESSTTPEVQDVVKENCGLKESGPDLKLHTWHLVDQVL
ncbi:hypothetical protein NHX12_030247 [Muraenolepis orangiensis]|uniref:Uncharacterized protein n=1 Tax=Muraenolepis orangiensis TaxID=630683 RepID=A0A9Q0EBD1_9TELE|nr:hypothetical protein NHX12_030247 [Muraenolepis orangiensis]